MAKKVVEVKDYDNELYGYSGGVKTYTPLIFGDMGIPEDKQFSVDIKPLSDKDCAVLRTINAKIGVDVALNRSGERGDKIAEIRKKINGAVATDPNVLIVDVLSDSELAFWQFNMNYENSLDDIGRKFDLVYPYISNLKNHRDKELTPDVWASMPNKIREDIYNEIVSISNVSVGESINLL